MAQYPRVLMSGPWPLPAALASSLAAQEDTEMLHRLDEVASRLARIEESLSRARGAPRSQRLVRPAGLLSLSAAARRLGRSKATVRRLIDDGAIHAVPWPGRRAKDAIPLAEIERIEREGVSRPVPAPPKKAAKRAKGAGRSERAAAVAAILAVEET